MLSWTQFGRITHGRKNIFADGWRDLRCRGAFLALIVAGGLALLGLRLSARNE
jgi:hypothetical protein